MASAAEVLNLDDMGTAAKLRLLRALRRYSQAEIGRAIGVSQNAVKNWCKGPGVPPLDDALRLADLLGVELRYLADDAIPTAAHADWARMTDDERQVVVTLRVLRFSRGEAVDALMAWAKRGEEGGAASVRPSDPPNRAGSGGSD